MKHRRQIHAYRAAGIVEAPCNRIPPLPDLYQGSPVLSQSLFEVTSVADGLGLEIVARGNKLWRDIGVGGRGALSTGNELLREAVP